MFALVLAVFLPPCAALPGVAGTWTLEGSQEGGAFGTSVSVAGDVNADGYSDLVVGTPYWDGAAGADCGKVEVFLGGPEGFDPQPAFVREGDAPGDLLGWSVALAGDVDGDGYGDVLVGAPGADPAGEDSGRAYVFLGGPAGPSAEPARVLDGERAGEETGRAVAWAGDTDGDGYDDILVGSPGYDGCCPEGGRVRWFRGGPGGPAGEPGWVFEGSRAGARVGETLAGGGDADGDGYDDFLVGAPGDDGAAPDAGRVFWFAGGAGGPAPSPGREYAGEQAGEQLGQGLAVVGDMNGDRYADLALGAPGWDGDLGADQGRVLVFAGGPDGPGEEPLWVPAGEDSGAGGQLGWSVAAAGDLNGDGLADLLAGAPGARDASGDTWLWHGTLGETLRGDIVHRGLVPGGRAGEAVFTAGDVDGDGYGDLAVGAPRDDGAGSDGGRVDVVRGAALVVLPVPSTVLWGEDTRGEFGYGMEPAGDVNGDGFTDVIVGDFQYGGYQHEIGRVYLYLGGPGGLAETPSWVVTGDQVGAEFGAGVASAGDVNGDGYDDILVAAPSWSDPQSGEGRVWLWLGSPSGPGDSPAWSFEADEPEARLGNWIASAGDVNGDGYGDVIVSAPGYPNDDGTEGRAFVFLGSPEGLAATPDWESRGLQAGSLYGCEVNSAGDVNGDGYDDVVVTDCYYNGEYPWEGMAEVYLGSPTGLESEPAWRVFGDDTAAQLGYSASGVGDLDGDGYGDLGVSAPNDMFSYPSAEDQWVYVYFGSPEGLAETPDWSVHSPVDDANFGATIRSAGDLDGDGIGDLLVGSDICEGRGRVYAWFGSPQGPHDGPADVVLDNPLPGSDYGVSASGVADVNGDGFTDVIVGAQSARREEDQVKGAVLVYHGDGGGGAPFARRQLAAGEEVPVSLGGVAPSTDSFDLDQQLLSPAGRDTVRLVADVREGTGSFADPGSPRAGEWSETALPETPAGRMRLHVDDLVSGASYRWRLRVERRHPFFPRGPWTTHPGSSATLTKLRTDVDGDGDGWPSRRDCDDGNADSWSVPSEARELRFEDKETLAWEPPSEPGGAAYTLLYDLLRSDDPGSFASAGCVETDDADTEARDPETPEAGESFSYLVRAQNGCGSGSLGTGTDGRERTGRECP